MQQLGLRFQSLAGIVATRIKLLTAGLNLILKPQKIIPLMITLAVFLSLLSMVLPEKARAVCGGSVGVPADKLTIKVGYFGGPYYPKKVYTLNDFDALPQVEQAYTFIDSMSAVCLDTAKGVKLKDLLEDAGIDVNSVQKCYFYATDIKKGWYQCLDKSFLLDEPRYYYPNLPSQWDYETNSIKPGAEDGAERVDTIIAYKDNWKRYGQAPDTSNYDTSTRFRLLFGQKDIYEHNAPRSAKWVHAIEIMLGGMPPEKVTLDQNLVNLKVGSTVQLRATVAPDKATDKSVIWSSSDPNVATVDEKGLVKVVGPGTAVITVSTLVGDKKATCVVNDPTQAGTGRNTMSADAHSPKQDASKIPVGSLQNPAGPSQKAGSQPGTNKEHLSKKGKSAVPQSTVQATQGQSGSQPWRAFEMSPDAVPLQQKEQKTFDTYSIIVFFILFFAGAFSRYIKYSRGVMLVSKHS
jgi:hypothetical protein